MHQLRRVLKIQLLLDVSAMGFNRLDAQVKFLGDGPRAVSLADQAEDFQFAVAQFLDGRTGQGGASAYQGVEYPGAEALAQIDFAAEDFAQGGQDALGAFLFHNVTGGAGPQSAVGIDGFIVHGKNEHLQLGKAHLDIFQELNAAGSAEGDVNQRDIRLGIFDGGDGLVGVFRFADDDHILFVVDQLSHAFAQQRMIVNNQDASGVFFQARLGGRLGSFGYFHGAIFSFNTVRWH